MNKSRINQLGLGAVEVIVACLVVAVIGATGFVLVNHHKKHVTSSSSSTTTDTTAKPDTTTTQPAQTTQALMSIKEWSIQLQLPSNIKDAYYTTAGSNTGPDGKPNTIWLGLTSLNSSGCDISASGPSSTAAPVGAIIRVLPTDSDPVSGTPYTEQYPNGATIDGYYYAYKPWNNRKCASSTALKSIDSSFGSATKGAVKTTFAGQ